ncbi:MAG TPA: hypothetical protein VM865_07800 [Acidobacteriaceae bacterium]|jgi:hypothetical protein|nr:hypothetical protein [Acidobacteriaceae bacterium]
MLAEYDAAAWHATDAVLATHPKQGSPWQYVAQKTAAGWVVDFGRLSANRDKFLVSAEAVQGASATAFTVKSFEPAREDTGWMLCAAKAISTTMQAFSGPQRPYNVAVIPAENEELYVYLYPAQVKDGIYPLGADVRYRVSSDGGSIIEKRQMHRGIIESPPPAKENDETVVGGYHSHVLSDVPEDTDVLHVLAQQPRVPEVVITEKYLYTVGVDGKITREKKPR